MKNILMTTILALSMASAANAGRNTDQGTEGLTWEDFRNACMHPDQYHAQRPAQNIRVSCFDEIYEWEPAQSDSMILTQRRNVAASVQSDKFHVSKETAPLGMPNVSVPCPKYAEVQVNLNHEFQITCDEAIRFKGGLLDLCSIRLDDVRQQGQGKGVEQRQQTGRFKGQCERTTGFN